MRFLVDESVDIRVIRLLKELGHSTRRVPSGAANGAVLHLARRERRVLIARDSDFANIILYPPSRHCGVVHIAIHPPWFQKIAPALQRLVKSVPEEEFDGRVFVLEETGYHRLS